MISLANIDLRVEIEGLVAKAHALLHEVIESTEQSDQRAKSYDAKWWDRHRLHVLLDAAHETIQQLSANVVVAPWFLAELRATLEMVERWKTNPAWNYIEPSLKDKDSFKHSMAMLRMAEHFKLSKHEVEIVQTEANATPDLRVRAIGGSGDWLYVECIQPDALTGEPNEVPEKKLDKIVEKSMAKAKRQFRTKHPGVLAVLSYNQTGKTIEVLEQKLTKRLDETDRPYLAGFSLLNQGVLFRKNERGVSFTPIVTAKFISNLSYFGRIDFVSEGPEVVPQKSPRKIKEIFLSIIEKPKPSSRSIIRSKKGEIFTFFRGEGNINYKCGSCQAIIAERIWNLSISNIVVLCPSCKSYNEFPQITDIRVPLKGVIGFAKQAFDLDGTITLNQGVTIRQEETGKIPG